MFIVIFEGDCEASVCLDKESTMAVITEVEDNNPNVKFDVYEVGDEQKVDVKLVPRRFVWGEEDAIR